MYPQQRPFWPFRSSLCLPILLNGSKCQILKVGGVYLIAVKLPTNFLGCVSSYSDTLTQQGLVVDLQHGQLSKWRLFKLNIQTKTLKFKRPRKAGENYSISCSPILFDRFDNPRIEFWLHGILIFKNI